jgi:hypothetical protein
VEQISNPGLNVTLREAEPTFWSTCVQAFCLPAFLQAKKSVEEAHRRQALPFHLHVPIAIQFHNFSHDLLWAWNQRPEPFHNEPLDVICYQYTLLLHILFTFIFKLGTIIPEQALHGRFLKHMHPIYRIALHCFNVYINCSFFCPRSFDRQGLLRWNTKKGYRTSLNTAISIGDNCTKPKIWSC